MAENGVSAETPSSNPQSHAPSDSAASPATSSSAGADAAGARAEGRTEARTEERTEARTHGASRIGESVYWTAHAAGLALFVVALVLIVCSRGPRRRDALAASQSTADGD